MLFLADIEKEYCRIANDKGIMLSGDFVGTGVAVTGDADRIEQIISNLLSNAVKFTVSGFIGFSAVYRNDILTITVRDTGIGMSEETIRRIFTPFERAAVEICPEGFGLGLSITKGLVTLLKGEITVRSSVGEGSTFKVSIPLKETSEAVTEKCKPLPDFAKRLPHRIIVVEDDPVQMEITRDILERNGICCHACKNAKEVVGLLRKEEYDLILTDIQMPGTNGFNLLNLLRNSNIGSSRSIPIAAMTARGDEEKENFIKAGFADASTNLFKPRTASVPVVHYGRQEYTGVSGDKFRTAFIGFRKQTQGIDNACKRIRSEQGRTCGSNKK